MFELINIGKSALQVNKKQLEVVGNNIANVNTSGYSRQRVVQDQADSIQDALGSIGQGTVINRIERMRDERLDDQYWKKQTDVGYWEAKSKNLQELEAQLQEPSENGLTELFNKFWDSWDNLANNPDGPSGGVMRTSLIQDTKNLTGRLNEVADSIIDKRKEINDQISNDVNKLNTLFSDLSTLNIRIEESKANGQDCSSLLDQYDKKLDELTKYGDTKLITRKDGIRIIYFGSDEVVKGSEYRKLEALTDSYSEAGFNRSKIVWSDNLKEVNNLKNGELKSLESLRDTDMKSYLDYLDKLANNLVEKINDLHSSGYDLQDPPSTGHNFFDEKTTGAHDIKIDSILEANPQFISASKSGETGDNQVALEISHLRNESSIDDEYSFQEYYAKFLNEIGRDSDNAQNQEKIQNATSKQINNFRENVKGVSIDEETANLIAFQQSYQAAAKIIATANQMMDVIMQMV